MADKKILIADATVEFCEALAGAMTHDFTLRICHDGLEAESMLQSFIPDVVVMDLALPKMDGIALLERIAMLPHRPKILLTTRFISGYIESAISSFHVDMVVIKPCNIPAMVDRILDLTESEDMPEQLPMRRTPSVSAMLMDLDLPPKRRGYLYLEMCIQLYIENPGQPMTKVVYPKVASAFHTKGGAVERAMRQVIHESWTRRDDKVWRMYFRPGREGVIPRPTNAEFICRLAELQRQSGQERA